LNPNVFYRIWNQNCLDIDSLSDLQRNEITALYRKFNMIPCFRLVFPTLLKDREGKWVRIAVRKQSDPIEVALHAALTKILQSLEVKSSTSSN
jgi:hypothetical protein